MTLHRCGYPDCPRIQVETYCEEHRGPRVGRGSYPSRRARLSWRVRRERPVCGWPGCTHPSSICIRWSGSAVVCLRRRVRGSGSPPLTVTAVVLSPALPIVGVLGSPLPIAAAGLGSASLTVVGVVAFPLPVAPLLGSLLLRLPPASAAATWRARPRPTCPTAAGLHEASAALGRRSEAPTRRDYCLTCKAARRHPPDGAASRCQGCFYEVKGTSASRLKSSREM